MALSSGHRLGPYEIVTSLGAGGMGEVYRATDTTLGRQVAIKILPDAFASDPERLARFEREAKTLASLNHPHIAAIYGFEKSPSTPSTSSGQAGSGQAAMWALVMELVEGEDLSEKIKGRSEKGEGLAIDEAPKALFPTRIVGGGLVATNKPNSAVARDGRFLINQPVKDEVATPITLLMNWRPEAKK